MPAKKLKPAPQITLNEEQQAIIDAKIGVYACYAGPGSGKTSTCVRRMAGLIQEGADPDTVLALSFTATAAKNLRDRIEVLTGPLSIIRTAGSMTLHSLALKFAEEERDAFPFTLAESVLATEPVAAKLCGDAGRKLEADPRSLRSAVSLWKRNRVRPSAAIKSAEDSLNPSQLKLALAYKKYDAAMRESGVMDFDSLMYEMVEILEKKADVRARWAYKFVTCDEAQDCCLTDWQLLKLLSEKHGNLLCVGDPGQCQPPGTMVRILSREPKRITKYPPCPRRASGHWFGGKKNHTGVCRCGQKEGDTNPDWIEGKTKFLLAKYTEDVPIEDLTDKHKVISWTKHDQRLYPTKGRDIQTASRHYQGDLVVVSSNGNTTKMTPNHWVWARWNEDAFQSRPYFVYLMYREDRGFRIGISHIRRKGGSNQITGRGGQEQADKMWILKFVENKQEAEIEEEIMSLRYQIPQSVFHSYNGVRSSTSQIERIFASVPRERGFECLKDHNLLFDYPLIQWPLGDRPKFHGYFKTAACNLFPEFMSLPTTKINGSALIDNVSRERYDGLVYSLNVAHDHTYVADGIPVGNSIYGFRGASPKLFLNMEEMFPTVQKLYLATNYRSSKKVVDFLKQIGPVRDLADKFHTPNEEGVSPVIKGFLNSADESKWVVDQIKGELWPNSLVS
jgi:hypothetical protein